MINLRNQFCHHCPDVAMAVPLIWGAKVFHSVTYIVTTLARAIWLTGTYTTLCVHFHSGSYCFIHIDAPKLKGLTFSHNMMLLVHISCYVGHYVSVTYLTLGFPHWHHRANPLYKYIATKCGCLFCGIDSTFNIILLHSLILWISIVQDSLFKSFYKLKCCLDKLTMEMYKCMVIIWFVNYFCSRVHAY